MTSQLSRKKKYFYLIDRFFLEWKFVWAVTSSQKWRLIIFGRFSTILISNWIFCKAVETSHLYLANFFLYFLLYKLYEWKDLPHLLLAVHVTLYFFTRRFFLKKIKGTLAGSVYAGIKDDEEFPRGLFQSNFFSRVFFSPSKLFWDPYGWFGQILLMIVKNLYGFIELSSDRKEIKFLVFVFNSWFLNCPHNGAFNVCFIISIGLIFS